MEDVKSHTQAPQEVRGTVSLQKFFKSFKETLKAFLNYVIISPRNFLIPSEKKKK